ncbi:MAG: cytochrome c, partial [Myxococcales bacterium]|nr:cytochrome c [Myxococcales bacterium]
MKRVVKGVGVATLVLALAMVGFYGWATLTVRASLSRTLTAHEVDIPVPFPLTEEELAALREERRAALAAEAPEADTSDDADGEGPAPDAGPQAAAGSDAEGAEAPQPAGDVAPLAPPVDVDLLAGVDLEALALERAIARGEHLVRARYACGECHGQDFSGGVMVDDPAMGSLLGPNLTPAGPTHEFTMTDWDHIVRHGILADGRPAVMPSEDFVRMSDRELSDIVAYLRAQPAVSNEVGD